MSSTASRVDFLNFKRTIYKLRVERMRANCSRLREAISGDVWSGFHEIWNSRGFRFKIKILHAHGNHTCGTDQPLLCIV